MILSFFFFSTMSEQLASLFYGIISDFNKKVFDKRVLNQKVWLGLLALNGVFLNAFEYQISARVGSFSRIAFNQSVINSKKGIYPTGSYVTTTGALQVDSSLLPKGIENHKLGFGVGGEIGSLAYDSTKFLIDEADPKAGFQPANWYYMGRWEGYLMQHSQNWTREQKAQNARPYVLYNLYLDYQYKDIFGIKLGRYPSKALFFERV